ncbi:MBL fold metallo-hydrolase [Stetteria hydrogenophila]
MPCINVVFAGTGSALHPYRGQSSVVLEVAGILLAVDLGCAALNVLERTGLDPVEVNHVIVTHGHYDHICGIPHLAFLKSFRGTPRISLAGPAEALDALSRMVSAVRGDRRVSISYNAVSELYSAGVRVVMFEAAHTVPAFSVSVEHGGVRVVISGDTRPMESYKRMAADAALAVHEATMPPGMEDAAAAKGHSTVSQAAEQVSAASLGALYHLTVESERAALKASGGRVLVPFDGTVLKVC